MIQNVFYLNEVQFFLIRPNSPLDILRMRCIRNKRCSESRSSNVILTKRDKYSNPLVENYHRNKCISYAAYDILHIRPQSQLKSGYQALTKSIEDPLYVI